MLSPRVGQQLSVMRTSTGQGDMWGETLAFKMAHQVGFIQYHQLEFLVWQSKPDFFLRLMEWASFFYVENPADTQRWVTHSDLLKADLGKPGEGPKPDQCTNVSAYWKQGLVKIIFEKDGCVWKAYWNWPLWFLDSKRNKPNPILPHSKKGILKQPCK